jgi:hypothetical protein
MVSRQLRLVAIAGILASPWIVLAQDAPSLPIQEIIQKLAANEQEARRILKDYTYRQDLRFQELSQRDDVIVPATHRRPLASRIHNRPRHASVQHGPFTRPIERPV